MKRDHTNYFASLLWPLLQTQDFRVDQEKEPYIRVNTRELDRELCIRLSILYTKTQWSMLLLF